jgi:diadenylate cyclase
MKLELLKYLSQIIDVSIILILIYFVYKTFKGTKILRIFGFFIALFVLKRITTEFQLTYTAKTLGFLIDNALILFIIIFQDEIRKFINRIYSAFENLKTQNYNTSTEIIAETCFYFSNKKIGALILIERSISLNSLVSKGVTLNSDISKEILKNIFYSKSNLHDGAVIINKDKIVSAGNFTSLTKNDNFDLKYGTRHRSAIGISEESDCLAIIVSEERGEIRVAEFGKLSNTMTKDELKDMLDLKLSSTQTDSSKLAQIADSLSIWFKNKFKKK